jgi:hypothetical protein
MASKTYAKLVTRLQKGALAAKENINLSDFTSVKAKDVAVENEPFPHIVVDDFFKPEIYTVLCNQFNDIKARGLSREKRADYDKFHAFDMDYDGYLYIPTPTLDQHSPLRLFFSLEWNNFFSKIFKQFTTFETSFALHHHPPGDTTGFVHHDFVDKRFRKNSSLPNGVIAPEMGSAGEMARRRVISLLIYINNPDWQEGDGGETGIYAADGKTLLTKVPPVNNRLFAFQTSMKSMHAFQANLKDRNCLVQWFHAPSEML